jgi:hypothetical protein
MVTDQCVPFQTSANGKPELAAVFPTATQLVSDTHDTERRKAAVVGLGLIDQWLPFHTSMAGNGPPAREEYPTAQQRAIETHDTSVNLVGPAFGVGVTVHTLRFPNSATDLTVASMVCSPTATHRFNPRHDTPFSSPAIRFGATDHVFGVADSAVAPYASEQHTTIDAATISATQSLRNRSHRITVIGPLIRHRRTQP